MRRRPQTWMRRGVEWPRVQPAIPRAMDEADHRIAGVSTAVPCAVPQRGAEVVRDVPRPGSANEYLERYLGRGRAHSIGHSLLARSRRDHLDLLLWQRR